MSNSSFVYNLTIEILKVVSPTYNGMDTKDKTTTKQKRFE